MSNVIPFKPKETDSVELFNMTVFIAEDAQYELYMEINDEYTDKDIFEGMQAASFKFAIEHELVDLEPYDESTDKKDK